MLVRDLFKQQVKKTPQAVGVVFKGKDMTWQEIDIMSNRFANGLMNLGIKKGDRIAAMLTNSPEFLIAYLASLKSGMVFVPINFQSTGSHLEYIINHSESKVIICDDQYIPLVETVLTNLKGHPKIITVGEKKGSGKMFSFRDVFAKGNDKEPSVTLSDEDLAVFIYTAGTTGDPKGVVHTQFNCAFCFKHWANVFHMRPGKSVLLVLPLFHAFGSHCIALPALISGAKIVLGEKYQTQWALEAMQKHQVTTLIIVPAMGSMMINHPDFRQFDLSRMETLLMGGAMCPYELLKQWRDEFPRLEIINGYGQSESCPCGTGLWDVDILEKPSSVGKPWEVVTMKILSDEGKELPPREIGEIVYQAPCIMKEYYKDPKLTEETLRNGWLYSGDLGYLDEEGYVYIVDRKKDIIIRGGENISSMEIEDLLHQHPKILEASVIGAPHSVLGETVMAVVVVRPGQSLSGEEVIEYCRKCLVPFKVPTRVEFTNVLPRNPAGKVLKRELKTKYI